MTDKTEQTDPRVTELAARLEARKRWVSLDLRTDEKTAAEIIGVKPRTFRQWREEGRGPVFVAVGQRVTYRLGDIIAWLDSHAVDPRACAGDMRQSAATPVRTVR